ncbi:MAG: hypothetical protein M1814_002641 [Vezdaea aestivalis]|nr:MAG: hypothetical protein M1814_002641 [Vezdaea aestivalis]
MTASQHYRPSRPIGHELRAVLKNYFDEELYSAGLTLLLHLLTSASTRNPIQPAYTPPANFLSLAATLVLHPKYTTNTNNTEFIVHSNAAFKLLRTVISTVGPINADLSSAFVFTGADGPRRTSLRRRGTSTAASSDHEGDDYSFSSLQEGPEPVWEVAQDVWHLIGWAFSCATHHPARWERYRIFLDLLIDAIQRDWQVRTAGDPFLESSSQPSQYSQSQPSQSLSASQESSVKSSLLYKYILDGTSSFGGSTRRLLKAIFSTGTPENIALFPPLFPDETKLQRPGEADSAAPRPRNVHSTFDLDKGDLGDWNDAGSDQEEPDTQPMALDPDPHSPASASTNSSNLTTTFPVNVDPYSTHTYRLSLLTLLWQGCSYPLLTSHVRPDIFLGDLSTHLRFIPPSHLLLFTNVPAYLPFDLLEILTQRALRTHLRLNEKKGRRSRGEEDTEDLLLKDVFVKRVLGAGVERAGWAEGARAALWIEAGARLARGELEGRWDQEVVERGLMERRQRAGEARKKNAIEEDGEGDEAEAVLGRSEGRLKAMLQNWGYVNISRSSV